MSTRLPCVSLPTKEYRLVSTIVQPYAIAVAIYGDVRTSLSRHLESVCPCVGIDIYHRVFLWRDIVRAIHEEHICWLLPDGCETFIVCRTDLVNHSVCLIWLHTSWIVVSGEDPLEMPTDAIFCLLSKAHLCLHEVSGTLLTVCLLRSQNIKRRLTVKSDCSPSTIFPIEELVRTLHLIIVVKSSTTISATPVLDNIPISSLTAIAGGDKSSRSIRSGRAGRVHVTDDGRAFLCKRLWKS